MIIACDSPVRSRLFSSCPKAQRVFGSLDLVRLVLAPHGRDEGTLDRLGRLIGNQHHSSRYGARACMERIRVLIADDHEDFLEGIRDLLEPEFAVVGTAGDGQALLAAVENLKPDVVITDISMPQMSGIEAARIIMQKYPGIRIILITMHNNPVLVRQGLIAGVQGYVLKLKAVQELPLAIHQVLQGTPYISPQVKV